MTITRSPIDDDKKTTAIIRAFLQEYKALCDKHGCMVVSEGEQVEVVHAPDQLHANLPEYDYHGVESVTADRCGWDWKEEPDATPTNLKGVCMRPKLHDDGHLAFLLDETLPDRTPVRFMECKLVHEDGQFVLYVNKSEIVRF